MPEISQRARAHPGIIANLYAIPDDDIQLYMNAADAIVLPYRSGLNSGSMMLAYSFARPVIVSSSGCIPDEVDRTTGVVFSWDDGEAALSRAMLDAEHLRDQSVRAEAYRRAQRRHYLDVSTEFGGLVDEALGLAAKHRHRATDTTR
jgi:glycosyltransferase involved in cell wall biosynthesis